jgi:conjugal transfer pilus assembly protein TraW
MFKNNRLLSIVSRLLYFITLLFFSIYSQANNLGTYGHTYPITEPNLLTVIHKQLAYMQKTGELKQLENKAKADVKKSVQRPRPTIISTTTKPKQFFYTPSLVVPQNVYDGKGNLLYKQGTQINALDQSTYPKVLQKYHFSLPRWTGIWVFINADDQAQLNWVKRHEAQWQQRYSMGVKVVLTGGHVKTTTKALKHYVYFDQYGKISEKLGIEHVPSVLTQDKKTPRFLIQEIDVSKA